VRHRIAQRANAGSANTNAQFPSYSQSTERCDIVEPGVSTPGARKTANLLASSTESCDLLEPGLLLPRFSFDRIPAPARLNP
jgi:hypothetical protein